MADAVAATPLVDQPADSGIALLIVDMMSDWRFPDGERLVEQAAPLAPRIAALKRRCAQAGIPAIYANDNRGHWRSDFRDVLQAAAAPGSRGAPIAAQLQPEPRDYFVLKPKHSAFFATPLELMLRHLGATTLIVTGVTSDQCVLHTAVDARIRDCRVIVPTDCSATLTDERHQRVMRHLDEVVGALTLASTELDPLDRRLADR